MFELLPLDTPFVPTSLFLTVAFIVLFKLLTLFYRHRKRVAVFEKFPGRLDERHWLWGTMHLHPGPSQAGIDFMLENCFKFQRMNTVWYGQLVCILSLYHPETVKQLLSQSTFLVPKARGVGSIYEYGISWLGEGLLIANGQKWARNRRLLTPAFHFDILKPYVNIINQCTDVLLSKMKGFADGQRSLEVYEHINLLSLDIILKCAFSCQMGCQIQKDKNEYVEAVHRLSELWVDRSLNPLFSLPWVYFNLTSNGKEFIRLTKFLHDFSDNVIKRRREVIEREGLPDPNEKGRRTLDFLDIILTATDSDGKGLTDVELRNEVDTFMFEGHDTTTSGTSFILASLAEHPDIQERCRQEINAVLEGRDDDNITWSDLPKLEYLSQCIKEGLRLHTPVFAIQRKLLEDQKIDGKTVPAGTMCIINLYNLHHNPVVWGDDHMDFKPERFNPDNAARMDPYAFLPFSAGQRNCIGQNFAMNEMKIVIGRILHRFRLRIKPGHVVRKRMGIVMRPEKGIWLDVTPAI